VLEQRFGVELDLARGGGEATRAAVRDAGVLLVARLEGEAYAAGLGAQLFEGDAARLELMTVGSLDVAVQK